MWAGYIHADTIIDNLIADGKAVPMIVVMPNGRALPDDRPPAPHPMPSSPPPTRLGAQPIITIPFMDWIAKLGTNRTGLALLICSK